MTSLIHRGTHTHKCSVTTHIIFQRKISSKLAPVSESNLYRTRSYFPDAPRFSEVDCMMQLSSKNETHHSVMTSSLRNKILKINKLCDFSCDIDYNSRTDVFRDVISLIINQYDSRRPNGASVGHKVSASRVAQAREARL